MAAYVFYSFAALPMAAPTTCIDYLKTNAWHLTAGKTHEIHFHLVCLEVQSFTPLSSNTLRLTTCNLQHIALGLHSPL